MDKVITIGLIPTDCNRETIYCGDSSTSETIELNFRVLDKQIRGIDNTFVLHFMGELFTPNSQYLKEISKFISTHGIKLPHNSIYNGFSLLLNGLDSFSQKFRIVESIGGTFNNQVFKNNGKIYLRMYFDKNGEILRENVCIKEI